MFTKINFTIPSFLTSALYYGDFSALSDEDIKILNEFLDYIKDLTDGKCYHWVFQDVAFFAAYHDVDGFLASDCVEAELLIEK